MPSLSYARRAEPHDAAAIADVVHASWRERYGQVWPPEVWELAHTDSLRKQWEESLSARPADSEAIVAIDDGRVVGFAAWTRLSRDSAELTVWEVAPEFRARGHAARLLAASVDTARDAGVSDLHWWAGAEEEARMNYVQSTGWALDGATRSVTIESIDYIMDQRRWVTSISMD